MSAARCEQAREKERPAAAKADGQDDDKEMAEAASQQEQPSRTGETARRELAMAEPADHDKPDVGRTTPVRPRLGTGDAVHQVYMGQSPSNAGTREQLEPGRARQCAVRDHTNQQGMGWTGQPAARARAGLGSG